MSRSAVVRSGAVLGLAWMGDALIYVVMPLSLLSLALLVQRRGARWRLVSDRSPGVH